MKDINISESDDELTNETNDKSQPFLWIEVINNNNQIETKTNLESNTSKYDRSLRS